MSVFNIGADGDGHGLKWIYTTTHCVTPYGMTHTDQKYGQLEQDYSIDSIMTTQISLRVQENRLVVFAICSTFQQHPGLKFVQCRQYALQLHRQTFSITNFCITCKFVHLDCEGQNAHFL